MLAEGEQPVPHKQVPTRAYACTYFLQVLQWQQLVNAASI